MNKLTLDDMARAICGGQGYCPDYPSDADRRTARAILTTIEQAGYRIVPVEASAEMLNAPHEQLFMNGDVEAIWQTMLNAAPKIEGE